MAESPQSDASHDSHNESTTGLSSKIPATKDKKCQYCGQLFTSSSLGRHLDQYLHKKKPDGIHDVDEIRRLRGGITRRTARQSKAHDHDDVTVTNGSPAPPQASPPVFDNLNGIPAGGLGVRLNMGNWHTTGVITDLSNLENTGHNSTPTPISAVPVVSMKRPYSSLSLSGLEPTTTEKDTTRALELALREVLESLRAATTRAAPRPTPFTFDIQAQTFPALVLRLLPTPPTLFSSSPFQTSTSAPLEPPTSTHLELLRLNISTLIQRWKWDSLRIAQTLNFPTATSSNLGEEADFLSRSAIKYEELASKHLDLAFATWISQPPETRVQMWQIELHRALASEQTKNKELEESLERITQEANRLQGQVEHLSRCQWPREMALWPPERVRFTKLEKDEIKAINLAAGTEDIERAKAVDKWDYELLVGKWKKHVREDKSRRTGVAAQTQGSNGLPTANSMASVSSALASTGRLTPPQPSLSENHSATNGAVKKPRLYDLDARTATNSPVRRANGASPAEIDPDTRRKSMRQKELQMQQFVGQLADQTDEMREFTHALQDMNKH